MLSRTDRQRPAALALLVLGVAGCHSAPPPPRWGPAVTTTITQATLDSLPRLNVRDGQLVCQADGESPCPVNLATANWLRDGRFATWEPHRRVQMWIPGTTDPVGIGDIGTDDGQYTLVVSVASIGKDYVVIDAQRGEALHFDAKAKYQSALPVPPIGPLRATGYTGSIAVSQAIREGSSSAEFQVREIDTPGDTIGELVLSVPLPWLQLKNGMPAAGLPLFPTLPAYAVTADSDIVWTPADSFTVRRQSRTGVIRWTLAGAMRGPAITPAEIAAVRSQVASRHDTAMIRAVDSSVAHTGKYHPALTGLVASPDGRVLLAGAQIPASDSVGFYVISRDGQLSGRFTLSRRYHVLLFAGDSVLIQRPEPNMQQQMRWLSLKR